VSWPTWGPLLSAEGWREDELLGPWGVVAGGRVLGQIALLWPRLTIHQRLCVFGIGTAALTFERDCAYSRAVMAGEE
jgi:hypothetical protein